MNLCPNWNHSIFQQFYSYYAHLDEIVHFVMAIFKSSSKHYNLIDFNVTYFHGMAQCGKTTFSAANF